MYEMVCSARRKASAACTLVFYRDLLAGLGLFVHFGLSFTIAREHRSMAQYRAPVPGDLEFTALSGLMLVCSVVQLIESGAAVTIAASWVWMGSSSDEADTEQHGPLIGQLVMFFDAAIRITVFLITAYLSLVTGSLGVAISGKHLCSNCDILVCYMIPSYLRAWPCLHLHL